MAVASKTWTAPYGRYVRLRITAQEVEVDTPNNRSKVRVTGQVYYNGGTTAHNAYPQTYTVTVNGTQIGRQTGFTYSLSSGGTKNLTTYTSGWIAHNSNGAKSVTVRGHITDNAGDTGTINQSYALTTIARASTLSSFSMPNHLKPGTTTTFNLGISRKSSSFTHDIQLRDGSTVIASWTGQGTPTTRSLTAAQTNTLLNRMSSSTSRTMTLRVQTKSGSTNIGGALTRTATVYVHSDVKPSVSALSVTIEGNAHAKNTVKRFVQNISKVSGKFTRSAKGGASIKSSKLEIRRKSGGSDLQTINSNSGTFPRVVAFSGQYQARGTATDTRGRSSNTGWLDLSNFDVLAYAVPRITRFSTDRRTGTETTVDIVRQGTFSGLSGSNNLTIKLQKRASGATSWTNVVPDVTATTSTFGATVTSTGHSVASSYDFRLYIVDQFGNSVEQISTIATQRVVLDIHKNEGVGIGKIHEQGDLDIDGSVYLSGKIEMQDIGDQNGSMYISPIFGPDGYRGLYFRDYGKNLAFRMAQHSIGQVVQHLYVGDMASANNAIQFDRRAKYPKIGGAFILDSGTNTNGTWVQFYDGTQICTRYKHEHPISAGTEGIEYVYFTFSKAFVSTPHVTVSSTTFRDSSIVGGSFDVRDIENTRVRFVSNARQTGTSITKVTAISYIAIGRWI